MFSDLKNYFNMTFYAHAYCLVLNLYSYILNCYGSSLYSLTNTLPPHTLRFNWFKMQMLLLLAVVTVSMEPVSYLVIVRIHKLIPSFKNFPSKKNCFKEERRKSLRMRGRTGPGHPVTTSWVGHVVAFTAIFTVPTRREGYLRS